METPGSGRTEQFARIAFDRDAIPGGIVAARVTGHENGVLQGVLTG